MTPLARFDHVTRTFGETTALDDVSLDIDTGRICGLLGPNGAGKTTMMSLLQGLRRPTSGRVELFGGDPSDHRVRSGLGSTPQETALPQPLRVGEILRFVSSHFADPVPIGEIADQFGLTELLRKQAGALSGGQKRRVSVALAFIGRPKLVLLDEPTTGLDVDARHVLWEAVRNRHDLGATIVVTSHYLEEIEALAERVIVVDGGRVIADDSLATVLGRVSGRMLRLNTPQAERIAALPGVASHTAEPDGSHRFFVHDGDAVLTRMVRESIPFENLTMRGASLEEAFLALTEKTPA